MDTKHGALSFPSYTVAERAADRVIHCIGVPLSIAAALLLLYRSSVLATGAVTASVAIYVFGLVGMVASSAAYQLSAPGIPKERLRRLDRAMIFVMIAGTYTPLSVNAFRAEGGAWLCGLLWAFAAVGVFISLAYPRRFERPMLVVYLAMGWMVLGRIRECFAVLPHTIIALIIAGGVVYTVGVIIQSQPRIKFHNPIWHALILCAASLHYAAISLNLTGGII
jgi:hemolysin III